MVRLALPKGAATHGFPGWSGLPETESTVEDLVALDAMR